MRTKEFIIFILIYTVCYFFFFYIIDKISDERENKKYEKNILKMINIDKYKKFAVFYGIQSNITLDTLTNIYNFYPKCSFPCQISELANNFGVTPYELIVIILFLEYIEAVSKKVISYQNNLISNPNYLDQKLIDKYSLQFKNKKNINDINNELGANTYNDIYYLNANYLIPGVRFINNQLYYVGDIYEEN